MDGQMTRLSGELVRRFFVFQNELRLYHWRTENYARHKATDHLYETMDELVDRFMESYMGTHGRVRLHHEKEPVQIRTFHDKNAPQLLREMVDFLSSLDGPLKKEPALLNLRDEMVSSIYQTLYLFELR